MSEHILRNSTKYHAYVAYNPLGLGASALTPHSACFSEI